MTKHEKHMKLIDDVNNAKTRHDHEIAYWLLHGWRKGMSDAGHEVDLCAADLTQMERGHENRNMTCGIFHDWKPDGEAAAVSYAELAGDREPTMPKTPAISTLASSNGSADDPDLVKRMNKAEDYILYLRIQKLMTDGETSRIREKINRRFVDAWKAKKKSPPNGESRDRTPNA